jgi:hypothetical protein
MEMFESCQLELATSSNNLSCITHMLIFLVRLMTSLNEEEAGKIEAALSPIVHQSNEQVGPETA